MELLNLTKISLKSKRRKILFPKRHQKLYQKKIFVVHGRNNELKETTARFLEKLGLIPVILHEQANQGKTIIEKFEDYSDVDFAVVLMTPDDIGYLANEESFAKYRARQNVVFELGYFIGKLGRTHVVAIVKGDIEIPTDISGVLYIGVDNNDAWKMMLAKEIKGVGYNIDLNKLF
ncbi:TIR domain-containing protein [Bacteroides thetaiotaomicron]|uniref:TIR domain-containing protein n=1 Tax=Bacteroides thetaiotaomicron TaxID=818 RepID=UPI0039C07EC7